MTVEQVYLRRLARKYGKQAARAALRGEVEFYSDRWPYNKTTVAALAKRACWCAFQAHPELREP